MRKLFYICIVLGSLVVSGCFNKGNEAKKEDTRVLMRDSIDSQGVQRMQASKNKQTVVFKGKEYQSDVQRIPNDSLPRVKNEMGDVFVDNTITLRLTQGNERIFYKTFTKRDFSSLVNEEFMKNAILEGMVFDKVTSNGLVYAVSISYPQTDLYFPISVTITSNGKMTMKKDELMEDIYPDE